MSDEKGWICLHRKFTDWEWYDNANVMRIFVHLLLNANHRSRKWRGKTIERGQLITSQPKLANSLKLSVMQIRTGLSKLKTTGEITVKSTSEYSLITIKNYDTYQQTNSQSAAENITTQQTANTRLTTNNNENNRSLNNCEINNSLSKSISKAEREILKSYAKKQGARNIPAYVRKLIDNGDYEYILTEHERKQKRKSAQALSSPPPPQPELTPEQRQQALESARKLLRAPPHL